MRNRPLALVLVLAGGDYLLWNWLLQGNHDVLALVSGLTLPPLAIALIWLLALNATRLLARAARAPRQPRAKQQRQHQQQRGLRGGQTPQQLTQHQQHPEGDLQRQASSSSKLAA